MSKKRKRTRGRKKNVIVKMMILRYASSSAAGYHGNRSLDIRKGRLRKSKHRKVVQDDL